MNNVNRKKGFWVVTERGNRLCKDGKWREFACFGTYPECVKVFKCEGWAMKAAEKYCLHDDWELKRIREGQSMDACGRIFERETNGV